MVWMILINLRFSLSQIQIIYHPQTPRIHDNPCQELLLSLKKRYLEYHLTDAILYGEGTIQEWENRLATHSFYSTYRGYLINIGHIQIIQQTHVLMDNGEQLPISRRKISPLQQLYADRIIHVLN